MRVDLTRDELYMIHTGLLFGENWHLKQEQDCLKNDHPIIANRNKKEADKYRELADRIYSEYVNSRPL